MYTLLYFECSMNLKWTFKLKLYNIVEYNRSLFYTSTRKSRRRKRWRVSNDGDKGGKNFNVEGGGERLKWERKNRKLLKKVRERISLLNMYVGNIWEKHGYLYFIRMKVLYGLDLWSIISIYVVCFKACLEITNRSILYLWLINIFPQNF